MSWSEREKQATKFELAKLEGASLEGKFPEGKIKVIYYNEEIKDILS